MAQLLFEAGIPRMRVAQAHRSAKGPDEGITLSRFLIQAYVLGLPLWWVLGIDWALPPLLAACLVLCSLSTYRRFTASDYLLLAAILGLGISAYINGLLIAGETMRFLAATYNLTILASAFIFMQAVREELKADTKAKQLLKCCFFAFLTMMAVVWTCLALAYAIGRFDIETPSIFGLMFGHLVPDSAPLIRDSTRLTFSQSDWGLPNVPMPRIAVYGPYPTATAATIAVLGSMSLLYLKRHGHWRAVAIPATELLIIATIATTLTRSILGGWLLGAIIANLIFGSAFRRILASAALVGTLIAAPYIQDAGQGLEYRSYSSDSRFENYLYAVERTFQSKPVFGLGIKPREEGNHIAVGSHSTFVSFFTKGGVFVLSLIVVYFVLAPALRWFTIASGLAAIPGKSRAELRILFNLHVAIWVWLCFEDIDAPASAAMLIFFSLAFIEQALRTQAAGSLRWQMGPLPSRPRPRARGGRTNAAS